MSVKIAEGSRLTLIEELPGARVRCLCACGNECITYRYKVVSGHTRSCGCLVCDTVRTRSFKHGESFCNYGGTKLYGVWSAIKRRCYNQNAVDYGNYGARGITMCDEWLNDYTAFRDWSRANGYAEGLEIDRRDNARGYEPSNCRFVPRLINARNHRERRLFSAFGESKIITEWAEDPRCVVSSGALKIRLCRRKMDPELAITMPNQRQRRKQ